jgi:hypothetical protein
VRRGAGCSVGVLMAVGAIVRALAGIVSLVIKPFEMAIGDGMAVEFVIAVVVVGASSSMRIGSSGENRTCFEVLRRIDASSC